MRILTDKQTRFASMDIIRLSLLLSLAGTVDNHLFLASYIDLTLQEPSKEGPYTGKYVSLLLLCCKV